MAFRRRSSTAPYEVMGAGPRAHAPGATPGSAPVPPVISKAPGVGGVFPGPGVGEPRRHAVVVMRIPRGWLAAFGVAGLVLIALAYWVGDLRGYSRGVRAAQVSEENQAAQAAAVVGAGANSNTSAAVPAAPSINPVQPTPSTEQPQPLHGPPGQRQPGYCYFVLVTSNQDGASALVKFLRDNGVDAGAFPSNNGRFYQVIALRGFRPDQLQSKERHDYESQLRALGRRWKARNHGMSDLSDMYILPQPYKGEAGA